MTLTLSHVLESVLTLVQLAVFSSVALQTEPPSLLRRILEDANMTFTFTLEFSNGGTNGQDWQRAAESWKVARFRWYFYLWAAVLASKIPAPCIQERTGVMPVGSGSSFMVRAPRGRLSWMENIKVSFWELCLHQKQERRIILPVPATQKKPTWIKVEKRGAMRRRKEEEEEEEEEEGHTSELPQSTGSWSKEEPGIPLGFSGVVLDPSPGSQLPGR